MCFARGGKGVTMTEELTHDRPSAHHIDQVCHDLKQHIAIGLLLSQPADHERRDANETRRLAMLHQQWEQAADLVAILNEEYGARVHHHADLVAVCRQCVDSVPAADGIALEVDGGDHVVTGDPVLLRRAVANLLNNASRATGATGRVRLRVGSSGTDSWVEVIDDGPGFGQIAGGTGLGLEIVRAAVWASGGQLRIDTGPTSGTSVRMTLPAALRSVP